jgi:hypothetical protein
MSDFAENDKTKKKSKHADEVISGFLDELTSGFLSAFTSMSNSKDGEGKTSNVKKKKKKKGGKKKKGSIVDSPMKAKSQENKVKLSDGHVKGNHKKEIKQTTPRRDPGTRDVKRDHIEQHREDYEAEAETLPDSIEQHREAYEGFQIIRHHDWYEQESLLGDLESLRRKPWYQKIKEENYCPEETALYNNLRRNYTNPLDRCWGEQNEEDHMEEEPQSDSEEIDEEGSANQDDISETVNDAYQAAFGFQDGTRLDFSSYLLPLPQLDKDRDRLEYSRRTIERMKRIEELRKSREEYKGKREAKKQRRKQRLDEIQNGGRSPAFWNPSKTKGGASFLSYPEPLLVDLTNIFDDNRRIGRCGFGSGDERYQDCTAEASKAKLCRSSVRNEIPIIVDLTNRHEPQPIIDLTNFEDPPKVTGAINEAAIEPNRRLLDLRKQQEEKLRHMTSKYEKVIKKKVNTKDKRDSALSKYQNLMERVNKAFANQCVSCKY